MRRLIFFLLLILPFIQAFAQNSFIKQYGRSDPGDAGKGVKIISASDGTYVFSGNNYEAGTYSRIYLYKSDSTGNIIWGKKISGNYGLFLAGLIETPDSGYMITGRIFNNSQDDRFWIKTNKNGDTLWTRSSGDPLDDEEFGNVIRTSDNGFLFMSSLSDPYPFIVPQLFKTDANGNLQWFNRYTGPQYSFFWDVTQCSDNSYRVVGYSQAGPTNFILHLDTNGFLLSGKTILHEVSKINKTSDGGYVVGGGIGAGIYILKEDSLDSVMWMKTFNILGSLHKPTAIIQTSNDGFMIVGSGSVGFQHNSYFIKLNAAGDTIWTKVFDGIEINDVMQDMEGNYVGTGRVYDQPPEMITLIKIDSSGTTQCPVSSIQIEVNPFTPTFGNFGYTIFQSGMGGSNYHFTIGTLSDEFDFCSPLSVQTITTENCILAGNFSSEGLSVQYTSERLLDLQISIADLQGRILLQKQMEAQRGVNDFFIPVQLSSGVYIVTVFDSQKQQSLKLVKVD